MQRPPRAETAFVAAALVPVQDGGLVQEEALAALALPSATMRSLAALVVRQWVVSCRGAAVKGAAAESVSPQVQGGGSRPTAAVCCDGRC